LSLQTLAQRIAALESTTADDGGKKSHRGSPAIEITRILFGGWTAFGVLFLILFFRPLHDAISAIPEKVKTANEIGVLGVSLKSTLRAEASRAGSLRLSETLPFLSAGGVELLLRAVPGSNSLVSYALASDHKMVERVYLPNEEILQALGELEKQGLVTIAASVPMERSGIDTIRNAIVTFRREHRGHEVPDKSDWRLVWQLDRSARTDAVPYLSWELTDLGKKAVDVILRAITVELSPERAQVSHPDR